MSDLPTKPPLVYSFPLRSRAQSLERQFHSARGRQSHMLGGMADGRRPPSLHPTAFYCAKEPEQRVVLLRIRRTYMRPPRVVRRYQIPTTLVRPPAGGDWKEGVS